MIADNSSTQLLTGEAADFVDVRDSYVKRFSVELALDLRLSAKRPIIPCQFLVYYKIGKKDELHYGLSMCK